MHQFKAFKYRIYPSESQQSQLDQFLGAKRWVYNYFLAENNTRYKNTSLLGLYNKKMSDVQSDLGVNDIPMALQKITNKTERSLKKSSKLVVGVSNRKDLIFA